jgi:bifunctional DNase/RNase
VTVSSRPSDAIALAARTSSPVFASRTVLDEAGVEIQDEDEEEEIEAFREFLDDIDPEDFKTPS